LNPRPASSGIPEPAGALIKGWENGSGPRPPGFRPVPPTNIPALGLPKTVLARALAYRCSWLGGRPGGGPTAVSGTKDP